MFLELLYFLLLNDFYDSVCFANNTFQKDSRLAAHIVSLAANKSAV